MSEGQGPARGAPTGYTSLSHYTSHYIISLTGGGENLQLLD